MRGSKDDGPCPVASSPCRFTGWVMPHTLVLFGRAIRAWWDEFLFLLVINLIWLLAQLTVVLGPPVTLGLYVIAQRVLDHDLVGFEDLWHTARGEFGRAWIWGAAQLVVYGVLGFNLLAYGNRSGVGVMALRDAWVVLLLVWFALNLYYWPLNLLQSDQRFFTTIGNAAKMALLNPGFTLAYALIALLFIAGSVLSGLLLGTVLGTWLALWGTLVVRDRLALVR